MNKITDVEIDNGPRHYGDCDTPWETAHNVTFDNGVTDVWFGPEALADAREVGAEHGLTVTMIDGKAV